MDKKIDDLTDLEISEALNANYQELMRIQANLQMLNAEITKRKSKVPVVEEKK